jgi:hypothetical protein
VLAGFARFANDTRTYLARGQMVQPELASRHSPLASIPPFSGGDFQGTGSFDPMMRWDAAQNLVRALPIIVTF